MFLSKGLSLIGVNHQTNQKSRIIVHSFLPKFSDRIIVVWPSWASEAATSRKSPYLKQNMEHLYLIAEKNRKP